eukprot:TRINITY_DN6431_c0_g1_i1.p4 TRINITY_DN6431_c0_g1~~TRINITY_DN6431_c0_g1_i1.p4  ORF type:complete len:54 (+),score=26.86 TRINITY_DN6431_c0_g1_i1:178-339(+)
MQQQQQQHHRVEPEAPAANVQGKPTQPRALKTRKRKSTDCVAARLRLPRHYRG